MDRELLKKEYFDWMSSLVINNKYNKKLTFYKLFNHLNDYEFIYLIEKDENRAIDGISLRYKFGSIFGYSNEEISDYLDYYPCTIFEMMIALSYRLEEQIMDDFSNYGDRTSQWFWNMIVSLGLGNMSDNNYDEKYVDYVLETFLYRKYEPNGKGGLFTLYNCRYDLTKEEIWYQAMWYLNENFDFSL